MQIPLDHNKNHIADAWEEEVSNAGGDDPRSDADLTPYGDGDRGDGFSFYEEYRGFMTKRGHVRTDPLVKTLFIESKVPNSSPGIDLFSAASGIEVYEIKENQMDKDRVVNFNGVRGGYANVTAQHGLRMKEARLDREYPGKSVGGESVLGPPPKKVDWVKIQWNYGKFFKKENLDASVAHELGHAVGMDHHGEGNYICKEKPHCLSEDIRPNNYIAVQQGQNSGVASCIMRYNSADYYEKSDAVKFYFYETETAPQTIFCDKKQGTGVNGEPHKRTGDAALGNCLSQICVNDRYH